MAQLDGVFMLDSVADDLVHEKFVCDTRDHEDHTFCGVMFDVECDTIFPADYIELSSVSVRGDLGPLTVWQTPDSFHSKHEDQSTWKLIYEGTHDPSPEVGNYDRLLGNSHYLGALGWVGVGGLGWV